MINSIRGKNGTPHPRVMPGTTKFEHFGEVSPGALGVTIRIPDSDEVGKPADVIITLPDGRIYRACIRNPARGFASIDTSFPGAVVDGFACDDLFKFLGGLYSVTDYIVADCFKFFEKDMLAFMERVVAHNKEILLCHDASSQATNEACTGLKELMRWIKEEVPETCSERAKIRAFEVEIAEMLQRYQPKQTDNLARGIRREIPKRKQPWVY